MGERVVPGAAGRRELQGQMKRQLKTSTDPKDSNYEQRPTGSYREAMEPKELQRVTMTTRHMDSPILTGYTAHTTKGWDRSV